MPNPFENPTSVFPSIVSGVNEAYEFNKTQVPDADALPAPDLADLATNDAKPTTEKSEAEMRSLESVEDEEARELMEYSFELATALFARIGLETPTPNEFVAAGVDFVKLADKYEEMESEKLWPKLVVVPSLLLTEKSATEATSGNNKLSWQYLFNCLGAEPANSLDGVGLSIDDNIAPHDAQFYNQEISRISKNPNIHPVKKYAQPDSAENAAETESQPLYWTAAIMSSAPIPQELGSDRTDFEPTYDVTNSKLPTISQYLTLHAVEVQEAANQPYIDRSDCTHLSGSISSDGQNCGLTGELSDGVVNISSMLFNTTNRSTGVRLPIWG